MTSEGVAQQCRGKSLTVANRNGVVRVSARTFFLFGCRGDCVVFIPGGFAKINCASCDHKGTYFEVST